MRSILSLLYFIMVLSFCPSIYAKIIPTGGEALVGGHASVIHWDLTDYPFGDVDIHLWDGDAGKWYFIASVPAAKGEFTWSTPMGLQGSLFRIRVQSKVQPSISFMSESYFSISMPPPASGGGYTLGDSLSLLIRLLPNPASEFVVASWEGEGTSIQIVDLLGRDVFHQAIMGSSMALSVQDMLPGLYIIKVMLLNGKFVYGRLLIESL